MEPREPYERQGKSETFHSRECAKWGQVSLQQLEILSELGSSGSISAAARNLGYDNFSTVLYHLKRLEDLVGAPLVNRGQRKAALTEIGQIVYQGALSSLQAMYTAKRKVDDLIEHRVRRLRIGVDQSLSFFLYLAWDVFRDEKPADHLQPFVYTRDKDIHESLVLDGLELYFTTRFAGGPEILTGTVGVEEMVTCCSADHPLAGSNHDVRELIAQSKFFVLGEGADSRLAFEQLLRRLNVAPSQIIEEHSVTSIKQRVKAGLGLAVLPRGWVIQELADGTLRVANTLGVRMVRQVYAARLRTQSLSEEASLLVDCFTRVLGPYS